MFITAMYLFGVIEGALPGVWWHYLLAFFADLAIAGAIGSKPVNIVNRSS